MNKKIIISVILCIVCIMSLSVKSLAYKLDTDDKSNSDEMSFYKKENRSSNKADLFKNIIKATNGKIIEYGIMAEFNNSDSREKTVNELFKKLNENNNLVKKSSSNSESYSIEFHGNSIDGNIQSTGYSNHNIVKVDIVKQDNKYSLYKLNSNLDSILKDYNTKIIYYKYIKVKIENNNINGAYNKVIKCLKDIGDSNIKTETLENGYTSTTYTGQYEKIYSAGKPVDFNFSVVHYSTGTYIIMGTPEIIETY
ncbi:hypothetical protein J2Z42_001060 [Clostridium algifaecis]|uniref:TATA-box binding protein n=1 Tax=Clostridium algifaecis TaxID=1472040 RepID=A0ABS4KQT0_9CLOT|nr:hypothetical protein [Clostridium algifaecis]MBP2032395.1 hypothetical protein [Clostridium algifaecis]